MKHPKRTVFRSISRLIIAAAAATVAFVSPSRAEGTKELSPTATQAAGIPALVVWPFRSSGSSFNCDPENRISFTISNTNERLYYGFHFNSGFGATVATDVWVRIKNAAGTVVSAPTLLPTVTGNGWINDNTAAQNGPNIGGVTNGYAPLTFTPTAVGEYYIEIYRSVSPGTTETTPTYNNVISSPYWDMTVANTTGTKFPGRVFCLKWGFMTVANTPTFTASAVATCEPTLYSYSTDSTTIRIKFNSGFKPIAFDVTTNNYGVSQVSTWDSTRKSAYSVESPSLPNGYRLFLNTPDVTTYPTPAVPNLPTLASPAIVGCTAPYTIRYNMPAAGDARILLSLDGVDGYQPGVDRILEAFNVVAGFNTITWDGRNGNGVLVTSGASLRVNAIYQRGRFNLPIYDAEVNKAGFNVAGIAPTAVANIPLYWNDASLANFGTTCTATGDNENNITGTGLNNTLLGTTSLNAHAWNGTGNIAQANPAPTTSGTQEDDNLQCNDFGNVRTINSWGWGLQSSSNNYDVTFGCYTMTGNVFHDANGLTDALVSANSTPTTAIPASGIYANLVGDSGFVVQTVLVAANGTYTFNTVTSGNYRVVLSNSATPTTIPTPPTGWAFVGEKFGTGGGDDGAANGILINVLVTNANVTNANFGIDQRPVGVNANMGTQQYNPAGTQVPATTFNPTDAGGTPSGGTRIVAFPTGATSLYVNGTLYTAGTFPPAGIVIPTNTAGQPTQTIFVVPTTATTQVQIRYLPRDNANVEGTTEGVITVPFAASTLSIAGNVFNDADGNGNRNGSEALVNPANSGETLYAVLVQNNNTPTGNATVVAATAVSNTTGYTFNNVPANNNYSVRIVSKSAIPTAGTLSTAVTTNMATTWTGVSTGIGTTYITGLNTDSIANSIGNFTTSLTAVNFGLDQRPVGTSTAAVNRNYNATGTPVAATQFVATDVDNTVTSIRLNAFPTGAATLYVNGVSYTSGTFPPNGITVPATSAGNPTQSIFVTPTTPTTQVVVRFLPIDNLNVEGRVEGTATINFANSAQNITGNVWNDADGNGALNGPETLVAPANTGHTLYAVLVQTNNNASGTATVVASTAVNTTTGYSFTNVPTGNNYEVRIISRTTGSQPATNALASTVTDSIATAWAAVSRTLGVTTFTGLNTPTPVTTISNFTTTQAAVNFGLDQRAVGTNTAAVNRNYNATGTQVAATQFVATDADNSVASIRLNAFPTGAATLYVNGVSYTSGTFPPNGITVPATSAGNPTQSIFVTPTTPTTQVVVRFLPIDNLNVEGRVEGTATINFANSAQNITGNVWNDADGNGALNGSETLVAPANSGQTLYAVLVQTNNNASGVATVVASTAVNTTTGYSFSNVPTGNNYEVRIISRTTGSQPAANSVASAVTDSIATAWATVSRTVGGTAITGLNTPTPVSAISNFTTTQSNVNFGLDQRAVGTNTAATAQNYNPIGTRVPSTQFVATDADNTVASIRLNAFPTGAATLYVNGVSYTSGTFPANGITVPANSNGNPSQPIYVTPTTPTTQVVVRFLPIDNLNVEGRVEGTATINFAGSNQSITGNVWNDANGDGVKAPTENLVAPANLNQTLYAVLVQTNNTPSGAATVVASATVNTTTGYSFADVPTGNNYVVRILSRNTGTEPVATTASSAVTDSIATGWTTVSTTVGATITRPLNTPIPSNAVTNFTTTQANVNFGIEQKAVGTPRTMALQSYNPLGTEVTTTQFAPSDPDGTISSIRLRSFPIGIATLYVNNVSYNATSFPVGGITIPTNAAGNPTQTVFVVPSSPSTQVVVSYLPIDNAGAEGTVEGTVTIPFANSGISISGNAFIDANGDGVNALNTIENYTNTANTGETLYAVLVQTNKNANGTPTVFGSVAVTAAAAGYTFTNVPLDNTYEVRLMSKLPANAPAQLSAGSAATGTVATNWVGVSNNLGAANSPNLNTTSPVIAIPTVTGNVNNANFGIERRPTSTPASHSIATPGGNASRTLTASSGMSALAATDPEQTSLGSGSSIVINSVANMNGNQLIYNGTVLAANSVITNYDPNLLSVKFSGTGAQSAQFAFSFRDAAGIESASPANYTITWSTPLPVKMVSFDGNAVKEGVALTWVTADEKSLSGYTVERSNNGSNWTNIGSVKATAAAAYNFLDNKAQDGVNYYRLRIEELDGTFSYSKLVSVRFSVNIAYNVYPNPTENVVFISGNLANIRTIMVTDMFGRMIQTMDKVPAEGIDMTRMAAGSYFISIAGQDGSVQSFKVTRN